MMQKHSQLKIIVVRPNVDVPGYDIDGGGISVAANSRLYDFTTDALNIPDGSFGAYAPVAGSGNPIEVTGTVGSSIRIIQNRDTTKDRSPLYDRPLEESQWISSHCPFNVQIQAMAQTPAINNSWLVGAAITTAGEIPVFSEFDYRMQVTSHGDRTDLYNSNYNHPTTFGSWTSLDWTVTAYTAPQQLDYTIQALAENFNRNNQSAAVAIAIDSTGAGTGTLVSAIAALPVGSSVLLGYTDPDGDIVRLILDKSLKQSFVALAAALPGTAEVHPYALPTTQNLPGGTQLAGTAATCDFIYYLAIDEGKAYYDYRINTKRRIEIGLVAGFTSTTLALVTRPEEGTGQSEQLSIHYKTHERYNQNARPQEFMSYHVEFPNEILADATYDTFTVEHCHSRFATSGLVAPIMHTTMICVVSYQDAATPYFTGVANGQKTYIQDILNAFNTNNNLGNATLAI